LGCVGAARAVDDVIDGVVQLQVAAAAADADDDVDDSSCRSSRQQQ